MNVWGWLILFVAVILAVAGLLSSILSIISHVKSLQHPQIKKRSTAASIIAIIAVLAIAAILTPISFAVGRASTSSSEPSPTATNQMPTSTATPSVIAQTTPFSSPTSGSTPTPLITATTAAISPTASWLVHPIEAHFGADAPNHIINLILYPGEILSLTADVGTFMARTTNSSLIPVPLPAATSKVFVLVWDGDSNATPETIQVTGVSSGNIDWERRQLPTGTSWLSASMAVEQRIAGGLKQSPNCGNGCATVGYYILDSDLHIVQTSEPSAIT